MISHRTIVETIAMLPTSSPVFFADSQELYSRGGFADLSHYVQYMKTTNPSFLRVGNGSC
ncbi:MAG TPA: hypothetical protein DCS30_07270 [Rhizobiales bacterium]|nr:hypothetical protein [Hyphomicrobiales bacterium]